MKSALRMYFVATVFIGGLVPCAVVASLNVSSSASYDFTSHSCRQELQEIMTETVDSYRGTWLIPQVADIVWDYVQQRVLPKYYSSFFGRAANSYLTPRYHIRCDEGSPHLRLQDVATDTIINIPKLHKTWLNRPLSISQEETQISFAAEAQLYVKKLCYKENNPYLGDSLYSAPCETNITHTYFLSNDTLAVLNEHYTMFIFKIPQLDENNHTLGLQKKIAFKQVIDSLFQSANKMVHILDAQHLLIAYASRDGIPRVSIVNTNDVVQGFSYPMTGMTSRKHIPALIRVMSGKRVVYLGEAYPLCLRKMYITQLSGDCRSIIDQRIIKLPEDAIAEDVSYFGDYVALLRQPNNLCDEQPPTELQPIESLDTLDTPQ